MGQCSFTAADWLHVAQALAIAIPIACVLTFVILRLIHRAVTGYWR